MRGAAIWMSVVAGFFALAPAGAATTADAGSPRAGCAAVSVFLEEVLPGLVRSGDVVVETAPGIPVDIYAPPAGLYGSPLRLTSDSVFWKKAFAAGRPPSRELVSGFLAVQQYSATRCAGRLLERRNISVEPDSQGPWRTGRDSGRRVVVIGYPAFDHSGRDALLYVQQGGPYLTGEATLLRFARTGGHWKETAHVYLGSS